MEEAFKINQKSSKLRNDSAVQGTNDSSVLSKISAAQLGYCKDDYLAHFASKKARRSPLVNRGYYIRAKLINCVIKEFLNQISTDQTSQIINLGAGFDSTFFRLKDLDILGNTYFIEIDFPDVISRKINLIKSNPLLSNQCSDLEKVKEINGNSVYLSKQSNYLLIGIDLRNTELLEAILKSMSGFDENAPTFLLSEVVMTYMSVKSCNGLIRWIGETFTNCVLSVYEQINPFDPFGQVMCSHFNKLGSPLRCILKYPFEEDQKKRYKNEGFTDVFTIKASEFYQYCVPNEEKKRIDDIELFDEYEPWHLKCSHYILLSATKGNFCTEFMQNFYTQTKSLINVDREKNLIKFDTSFVKFKNFPIKFGSRFGHSVCALGNKIFVFGGFGELATDTFCKHLRLTSVEVVDLDKMKLDVIELPASSIGDRIFHSCKTVGNNSMIMTLGRSNPSKMFDSIVNIVYHSDNIEINEKSISYESLNLEIPRFRHSICPLPDSELFVYGGKFYDQTSNSSRILNDAYILDGSNNLKKFHVDENVLTPRHSLCINLWKNYLILSGGLDQHENPLNELIFIDFKTNEFRKVNLNKGYIIPRYSHTSHIIDDTLILVGGVNLEQNPPGVCFVDLNNLTAYEFDLPYENRLMLLCHQSHMIDKNNLLLVGGGAVCFTFGTHLNKQPCILDISECWSKINN